MDEELQAAVVHVVRLSERERLPNAKRQSRCLISVDPSLEVASSAFFLAGGLVLLSRDHPLVSFPEVVAVAGGLLIAFGNLSP